ncbi:hypothetical protein [Amycolatopsis sp. NBRC 101858]|uniref:hypothetical protein n=1 Tax=Amycolatopsis sp. NBRC 101858 TaxID=3032200 RepID=UPI0025576C4C|nr:hypothetical protein [Amycolatopsis sp. NBRC 101858]
MDEDYARKLRAWLRAEPGATPEEEREWLREVPAPAAEGGWVAADRAPAADEGSVVGEQLPAPQPDSGERWTVRGKLPAAEPELEEEWVCPVITLPVPRTSKENGCRISGAEARSRRDHPSGRLREAAAEPDTRSRRPEEAAETRPLTEAEARSRWNHPSSWHRRRRQQDESGGC